MAQTPVYQFDQMDAFWTELGTSGQWQVATDAEDWVNEIWERPGEDTKWTDMGGNIRRMNADGKYYAHGDIRRGAWGVGEFDGTACVDGNGGGANADYLYALWEINGNFEESSTGGGPQVVGLKSQHYLYYRLAGESSVNINLSAGQDYAAAFGGTVKVYEDTNNDVPGAGVGVTGEGGTSFDVETTVGAARTNGLIVELAVPLASLPNGNLCSDWVQDPDFLFMGLAVSNPSAPNSDVFANDFYNGNVQGQGVEYDTLFFSETPGGRIEIEKQTLPDGSPQSFTFSGDVAGALMDGDVVGVDVAAGQYTSTETVPAGWALTSIVCDDGASATPSTGNTMTGVATFNVEPGETVRCVFTNTQDGRIEIEKQTLPDGSPQSFTFAGDVAAMLTDGGSAFADVAPGQYSSTETVPAGWALTSIACDDGNSTGDTMTGTATFNVEPGETVRCVFTNTQDGRIEIEKQTLPDGSPQSFTFAGDVAAMLTDGGSAFADVAPGQYSSTETVPAGWVLSSIVCDDNNSTGNTMTATASFNVEPGETVRCVFTNTQDGRIEIEKQTLPDGSPQSFTFAGDVAAMLTDGGSAGADVAPGQYSSTETVPMGWVLTSIVCDDGASATPSTGNTMTATASFNVEPGETVRCVFTNTQDGRIEIEKQTLPDGSPQSFTFAGDVAAMLTDGGSAGADVAPGQYTSTETVPAGWVLSSIVCNDGNSTGNTMTATATFNVEPGETVRCVFNNTEGGRIEIEKQTLPDGSPQSFTFAGDVAAMLTDGGSAGADVMPGTYSSTETVPAGWDLTSIVCDDNDSTGDTGTGTATFNVEAGETVRCVFTNTQDGRIEIEKQTVPDGSPQVFTFAGDVSGMLSDGQSNGADVAPGQYSSTETVPMDWVLTSIVCDDNNSSGDTGTGTATFNVEPGETVRCVFTNTLLLPVIDLSKTLVPGSLTLEMDGSYTVEFEVEANNTGDGPGTYDIIDTATPGTGITLNTATIAYQVGIGEDDQSGAIVNTHPTLVTGEALAGQQFERWTLTMNFTVDPPNVDPGTSGCTPRPGDPGVGTGFYNIISGSETDPDPVNDEDCDGLPDPIIDLSKTLVPGSLTLEMDGSYTVEFEVEANNTGDGPGTYDIIDTATPGTGITLNTATIAYQVGIGEDDQSGAIVNTHPTLVTGEALAGQQFERWTLTMNFTVDPPNVDPGTSGCTPRPGDPGMGTGFYNIISGSETDPDPVNDEDCDGLPEPVIDLAKTITAVDDSVPGTMIVTYAITATNEGDGPGFYDLIDTIDPATGAIIVSATLTAYVPGSENDQSGTVLGDGVIPEPFTSGQTLVTGEALAGQRSEGFTIVVEFEVSAVTADFDCNGAGTGTYNEVSGSDTDPDPGNNADCEDIERLRTSFRVTKDFSDDNPAGVTVEITCNTGLPLMQSGVVHDPAAAGLLPGDFTVIEFIVNDFLPGTMNCDIEEVIPAGYLPEYTAGATTGAAGDIFDDANGCHYELIEGGQFTCHIYNELQPVDVVVEKEWIDENPQFLNPLWVDVTLECDGPIVGGFPCNGGVFDGNGGSYCAQQWIDPDNPGEFGVLPHFEGTTCTATEEPITAVLTDESDCEEMIVFPGQGDSCVIVNTRLYAGIPTLNQYGLILLALMMLGIGALAYRRFV